MREGKALSYPATRPWGPVPSRDDIAIGVLKIWKWIVNLGIFRKKKKMRGSEDELVKKVKLVFEPSDLLTQA